MKKEIMNDKSRKEMDIIVIILVVIYVILFLNSLPVKWRWIDEVKGGGSMGRGPILTGNR
jgi:hypothetical protein